MTGEGYVDRVIRTSFAVSLFVALFMTGLSRYNAALSYLLGAGIGLGFILTTRLAVLRLTAPGVRRGKWRFAVLAAAKYGIAAWLIWRFVSWPGARYGPFVFGAATTQIVLFLKAVGQMLADRSGGVSLPGVWWQPRQ